MYPTTVYDLGQVRLADLRRQAQRDALARAARRSRPGTRPQHVVTGLDPYALLTVVALMGAAWRASCVAKPALTPGSPGPRWWSIRGSAWGDGWTWPAVILSGTIGQMTDRAMVRRWLAGYEAAWRAAGTEGLAAIFTDDARYHH